MPFPQGAVAAAFLLLSGCVEAVSLGSQCPSFVDCRDQDDDGPGPGAPLTVLDGAVAKPPGVLLDGAVAPVDDASVGAADGASPGTPAVYPAPANPSFNVTRGNFGSLAYSPIDPIPLGTNLAEPWGACGFQVSVRQSAESTRGSGVADVLPTDGPGFVEANVGVPALQGLRQQLATPLKRDVRYSFRMDVRAAQGADVTLEVWGSFVDCLQAEKLADLGKLSEQWTSVCVTFVPSIDMPQLLLNPSARGLGNDARVFFDNIRPDPTCR